MRIVTKRGAGCDGRVGVAGRATLNADGEIAWSWRPDAGVKSCGLAMSAFGPTRRDREATEANKPGTPGRSRISRKPLRRECRLFWLPCRCLRAQSAPFFARKADGCGLHPAFPAPSLRWGASVIQNPGEASRGNEFACVGTDGCALQAPFFNASVRLRQAMVLIEKINRSIGESNQCHRGPGQRVAKPVGATFCLSTQRHASAPIHILRKENGLESCLVHARSRGRCRFTSRRTIVCRHIAAS